MMALLIMALLPGDLEGRVIDQVTYSYDGPVNMGEVQALWDLKAGDTYRQGTVEANLARLYRLQLFQDIRLNAERLENRVRLHLHLIRVPLIGRIRWEGAVLFDRERLRRISEVESGDPSRAEDLESGRQRLIHFFRDNGFPRVQVAFTLQTEAAGDRQTLTWRIQEGSPTTVGWLSFWGPRQFPDWRLLWITRLFPGTRISEPQIREARHRLEQYYLTRGYLKVRIDPPDYPRVPGPVNLVWHIDSGHPMTVRFTGNRAIAAFELGDVIQLFSGRLINPAVLNEHSQELERYYHDHGYPDARVRAAMQGDTVVFSIHEGPRVTIRTVTLTGAPPHLEPLLSDAVKPMHGLYRATQWLTLHKRLQEILHAHGYLQGQVHGQRQLDDPSSYQIQVVPGPRYRVSRVDVAGWPLDRFPALVAQAGLDHDPRLPTDDALHLTAQLREAGFPLASVLPQVAIDHRTHMVTIGYRVNAGAQQHVAHVWVRGLVFTRPQVIQRYLTVRPGEPLKPSALFETRRKLFETGLFRQVQVEVQPHADPQQADVVISVTEGQQARLGMGVGYASVDGASATLGYSDDNLGGWNRRLLLRGSLSWKQQSLSAALGEPYLGNAQTNGEIGLFALRQSTPKPIWRTGLTAGVHHVFQPALVGSLQGFAEYRLATDRQGMVLRTLVSALFDDRDSLIHPTSGSRAALDLMVSTDLEGQERLFKPSLRVAAYWPWDEQITVMASGRLAFVGGLGTPVPEGEWWQQGGPNGLRGFPTEPALTGRALLLGTLEVSRVLSSNWLGAVFVDVGSTFTARPDLRLAMGAGIRYVTPLGMVRLDGALKLDRRPGETVGALHLTLGDWF